MGRTAPRGRGFPDVMSVLFGLLAVSNASKALQWFRNPGRGGIVLFGVRMEGVLPNLLLGGAMALLLGAYAVGLRRRRAFAIPIAFAYALYVPLNLALFWYFKTGPEVPPLWGILLYFAVAVGGAVGTALWVAWHRAEFGVRA